MNLIQFMGAVEMGLLYGLVAMGVWLSFRILDFPTQERIIKKLQANKLTEIIRQLPPDDRTALLGELQGEAVKKLLVLFLEGLTQQLLAHLLRKQLGNNLFLSI